MMEAGTANSWSIQRISLWSALFSCSSWWMRSWARCRAAMSLGTSSCESAAVESVMLLSPSLPLVRCFHGATDRFIGDAVAFRDLAQRFALLNTAQDIGPL